MRELGNIKLALMCERFDVTVEYSIPVRIDLFALHILDIIAHKEFKEFTIYGALLGLGVPGDLSQIYEKSFRNLLSSPTELIKIDRRFSQDPDMYINNLAGCYSLTDNGREALASKELPSKIEKKSFSVVFDFTKDSFVLENRLKKAELDKSIIIENEDPMDEIMTDDYTDIFLQNAREHICR